MEEVPYRNKQCWFVYDFKICNESWCQFLRVNLERDIANGLSHLITNLEGGSSRKLVISKGFLEGRGMHKVMRGFPNGRKWLINLRNILTLRRKESAPGVTSINPGEERSPIYNKQILPMGGKKLFWFTNKSKILSTCAMHRSPLSVLTSNLSTMNIAYGVSSPYLCKWGPQPGRIPDR